MLVTVSKPLNHKCPNFIQPKCQVIVIMNILKNTFLMITMLMLKTPEIDPSKLFARTPSVNNVLGEKCNKKMQTFELFETEYCFGV
jgi:hypothetical protein